MTFALIPGLPIFLALVVLVALSGIAIAVTAAVSFLTTGHGAVAHRERVTTRHGLRLNH